MRVIYCFFGLLILMSTGTDVISQEIVRSTLSSFGSSKNKEQLYLSQTAGQSSMYTVFLSEGILLRQGFQQPILSEKGSSTNVNVLIYPNPNRGSFAVEAELSDQETYTLAFFDVNGKVIMKTTGIGNRAKIIDFPLNISPGMYFYQLVTENGNFASDKITITP